LEKLDLNKGFFHAYKLKEPHSGTLLLYPTVMANNLMPIGLPTVFEGDITKVRCPQHFKAFGFFYCEITSPTYLEHPIIQQRIKTPEGIRTIAGLGTWRGWIFSQEMYNAINFGYTFKIIKGYLFDKGNLFNEYVNILYNLRMEYDKTDPMNQSAKLLNNSLYGKFGMKDGTKQIVILKNVTPEIDNAIKHKYQIEIIKGHEFNTAIIFKEYVETMYELRMQYEKGHPMNYIAKLLMNSLYGKFGMNSHSSTVDIYNLSTEANLLQFHDLLEKLGKTVQDYTMFKDSNNQDHVIIVRDNLDRYSHTDEIDNYHSVDVNIAIAAAITAGGRVWMSLLKNSNKFNLYYSDTDSGIVDRPLRALMVGDGLGQFKLEYTIQRAVFLAPKVYAFVTTGGEEIIKVKGIRHDALSGLHVQDLENLLVRDSSKEFTQDKWFKSLTTGTISVKDVAYNLKITSNKRESIYENGIFEATMPYNYNDLINKS